MQSISNEEAFPSHSASDQAEVDSMIGTNLDGRYEILSVIASGGMGVVYRGRHILMDKIVAIKMLNAVYANEPGAFIRFQNEAKIACQLNHPNIVTVHDFGIADNKLYLVMDLLEGMTLAQMLDNRTFLPFQRLWDIVLQICSALEYAHEQGLIHRDLKPGNIMILPGKDGRDVVKVLDFGLAKFFGEGNQQLSQTGFMLGTSFYMSPEQCRGKKADVRSEIYSMSCLLYECVSGVPPFVGENVLETMQMHVSEKPTPMSSLRPELKIPSEVEELVNRGLSKDPDARFQSVVELRMSIEELRSSDPGSVPLNKSSESGVNLSPNEDTPPVSGVNVSPNEDTPPVSGANVWPDGVTSSGPGVQASEAFPLKTVLALVAVLLFSVGYLGVYSTQKPKSPAAGETTVVVSSAPPKQDKAWTDHFGAATLAFDKENYGSAEKLLQRSILDARHSGNTVELTQSLRKLQDAFYVQEKFKEAEALDQELLRLSSAGVPSAGPDPDEGGGTAKPQDERIAQLAMFCHKRGQCDTAIKLLERSVEISKKMYGTNSLQTAARIEELASLHLALDETDKAQPLMEQVMVIKSTLARKTSATSK